MLKKFLLLCFISSGVMLSACDTTPQNYSGDTIDNTSSEKAKSDISNNDESEPSVNGNSSSAGGDVSSSSENHSSSQSIAQSSAHDDSSSAAGSSASYAQTSTQSSSQSSSQDNPPSILTLNGNSFVVKSIDEYDQIKDDELYTGSPKIGQMLDPYIGSIVTFKSETNWEWTINDYMGMGKMVAYGTYIQNGETGTYTQIGTIQAGTDNIMPEELQVAHPITIGSDSIVLESWISGGSDPIYIHLRCDKADFPSNPFTGEVAGFSFKFLDYYVVATIGELRQDEIDRANAMRNEYSASHIEFKKDSSFVWSMGTIRMGPDSEGDAEIEGSYSQTGNIVKLLQLKMFVDGNLVQEDTPEEAEKSALFMTLDGETLDGVMGGGGSGPVIDDVPQYNYRYEFHIKHTLEK